MTATVWRFRGIVVAPDGRPPTHRTSTPSNTMKRAKRKAHGMNWIRQEKRLAIYMRDDMSCLYCGRTLEDGVVLTLDHLVPYVMGGDNRATNLVTACRSCNSKRQAMRLNRWIEHLAIELNAGAGETHRRIRRHRRRKLGKYLAQAKQTRQNRKE